MRVVSLNNGLQIPMIGLGTYKIGASVMRDVLDAALSAGYRAIDTAEVYRNEDAIGTALQELLPKYNLQQTDITITSKFGPKSHGYNECRMACERSLQRLGWSWLDLYLVHWPGVQGKALGDEANGATRRQSWTAMEDMYREGKLKAIGVSNYTVAHLDELLSYCKVKPAVLQVECHPYLCQTELREYCRNAGIHFQAYSSLGSRSDKQKFLSDDTLMSIAARYNKSVPQILLRWSLQQDIGVIPMSTNRAHITENIDVEDFTLTEDDIQRISAMDRNERFLWNPKRVT